MIFDSDKRNFCDGEWHCPFPKHWVDRMAQAAACCCKLTSKAVYERKEEQIDFLNGPQDERGLPLSFHKNTEDWPACCSTYDYGSIAEVVVTNGQDDWPLGNYGKILIA
ncbi:MAG: hypothetical protein K6E67_10485 [Prevotella sp.]|nr:hypothetical protein [Prevotella sp.]